MKKIAPTAIAAILLALIAAGIESIFKIGISGNAPFWQGFLYYLILFVLIEAIRAGVQKVMDSRRQR